MERLFLTIVLGIFVFGLVIFGVRLVITRKLEREEKEGAPNNKQDVT